MKYFAYALIPLACLVLVFYLVLQNLSVKGVRMEAQSKAEIVAKEVLVEFNYLLQPLVASNVYLARSNSLRSLLNEKKHREAVLDDFSLLSSTHPLFQQVRLLDTNGMEVLRVNCNEQGAQLVGEQELQDKSKRNYFLTARSLESSQVYITPIDLNVEHGRVEEPYNAVFRIISPVDSREGRRIGYLVYNVGVAKLISFLDVLEHTKQYHFVLLNSSGDGLVYDGSNLIYRFANTNEESFINTYQKIWAGVSSISFGRGFNNDTAFAWREFDIRKTVKPFTQNVSFFKPADANIKLIAFVPVTQGKLFLYLSSIDKWLITGLILTFLMLAANFAWGRVQMNKRHELISNLNDELIKSQAQINHEKYSLKSVVNELTLRNNQLSEFSSIVSHNIRAPLSSLTLLVDYVNQNFNTLSYENRVEAFEKLKMSSSKLNELASDLWRTVKILDSKDVELEKLNLHEVLSKALKQVEDEVLHANLLIKTNFEDWIFLIHNEGYLTNILVNLISNSIKYRSPSRGLEVEFVTEMFQEKKVLRIVDNGRGINMDWHSNNVFGMHQTFHADVAGRGMGLFMVKMQVEALGGNVFVESKENEGSTFTIMF